MNMGMTSQVPFRRISWRGTGLIGLSEAFSKVHFPEDEEGIDELCLHRSKGHRRIIFDEFFFLELGMALRKKGRVMEEGISFRPEGRLIRGS